VFWKIRLTIDPSAIATLGVYTVSMVMRMITWSLYLSTNEIPENKDNVAVSMIDLLASMLIWIILYYFIFEMRIVKDKL
jgi:hypothetical protein